MQFSQHGDSHHRVGAVRQDHVGSANGAGRLQQIPDLPMGSWFPRCRELWWVTSCPQGVKLAQAVDVRPDTVEDLALFHVV